MRDYLLTVLEILGGVQHCRDGGALPRRVVALAIFPAGDKVQRRPLRPRVALQGQDLEGREGGGLALQGAEVHRKNAPQLARRLGLLARLGQHKDGRRPFAHHALPLHVEGGGSLVIASTEPSL